MVINMAKIMIIEDEKSINDLIMLHLKLVGHECIQAFDGNEAISSFEANNPDLILLDVMIPFHDGFELIEQNSFKDTPVIFVTAKENTLDKVKGLNLGAYDYIVKPFEMIELIARVEAVLRRVKPINRIFSIDNTIVYLDEHVAKVNGENVELTNREFELLLLDMAWGYDYFGDTRTVDVHITKLRKKLHLENHIKTIFKLGYRLEVLK